MVSGDLLINTAVSKPNKNELPLKADHWERYLLVLKWECQLSGNIFITDDCRIISELLECLGGGLVHTKGSQTDTNTLVIKTW